MGAARSRCGKQSTLWRLPQYTRNAHPATTVVPLEDQYVPCRHRKAENVEGLLPGNPCGKTYALQDALHKPVATALSPICCPKTPPPPRAPPLPSPYDMRDTAQAPPGIVYSRPTATP
ncbi:hypothetical protein TraAM80_00454 [Trypanosoma rangeli]|uniref:Uncharacterized protein n=1 Tax=Trypanosoma rangeli TaxID=5698 RepID=A0A422P377_TRYRA|nr:uncharacterized protein TraAM80_00454 [Trypanosoma rangeli]RNF12173.1 hypothetical protein TraAM80_00454 [Trypanosoma rangeli]|eukprot:RNF12173.1 hypothetical protein TraAM80_00454 [Trypanosoma rangeli]